MEDLIQRYFANKVTEEERSEILRLIQAGQIEEVVKDKIAQTLLDEIHSEGFPDFETKSRGEEIFKLIVRNNASARKGMLHVHKRSQGLRTPPGSYSTFMRYAAAFIVLGVAGLFVYPWKTTDRAETKKENGVLAEAIKVVNSGNTTRKVTLQDGSIVTLEPGSEVRYAEKFANHREIYLSGDAFFEVTKDPAHPFFVYANEITTKVLGTSFRVKAKQGEKEIVVAVKTGKVSVFAKFVDDVLNKNGQEITLTPNQQIIYKRSEHVAVKKIVEEPEVIAGRAVPKDSYVNEPVILILKALSESYGIDIQFNEASLSECTLTSDIIKGEGLYDQLEIICNALGGTYKMENASIIIEANGCQSLNVKP